MYNILNKLYILYIYNRCFFSERCNSNLSILFLNVTFADGLKQKSCTHSEKITYYTLMNRLVDIQLFNLQVSCLCFCIHCKL